MGCTNGIFYCDPGILEKSRRVAIDYVEIHRNAYRQTSLIL